MRKQFLLLFLMTLLPLAGWAAPAAVDDTGLTLKARTFNGQDQTLLEGTYSLPADYDTSVGGVLFAVTTTPSAPASEVGATSEFPKKRNVGLYYIWYKALPDGGTYNDVDTWHQVGTTGVRINKAAPTMTAPVGYSDLRYNEGPQALIQTPGSTNLGDMMYSLNQTDWFAEDAIEANITGQDKADYTVYYKAVDEDNLKDNTGSIVVRIYGIAPTIQAPVGDETLVYNGAPQQLIATAAALTTGDGTLKYSLDKSTWYTDIADNNLKATNVSEGGYKVYYKMDGGTNYEDIEEHYITVNIAPKSIASDGIVITAGELAFTGAPLVHTTLTVKDGLTDLTQDTDFEIYAAGYNNNTNAGTTAVAAIKGKGNYTGTATETFTISALDISGLAGALLPSITAVDYNGGIQQPSISWTLSGEYEPSVYNAPNGDYSIVIKNAAETAEVPNPKDAATYKVIFTGHNNLTSSLTVDYVINKADVTVTANAVNIGVGVDPASYFDVTYEPALFGTDNLGNITYKVTPNTTTDFGNVNTTAYTAEQVANLNEGTYHIWAIPAGNDNYKVTEAYGVLTLSAGQIIAKVEDQSKTFGTEFDASQIVHVSGLSAGTKVTAFNNTFAANTYNYATNGVVFTIYDENGEVAQPVEGKNYYPVGTYTVKTTGSVTYPNYNVVLDWGTYTVTEQSLEGVACAALSATYAGEDVTPNTTGKLTHADLTLVEGTDYDVELVAPTSTNNVDNKNVSNTTYKGKVKFTAVPGSNYSGSKLVDFTITRRALTITAEDKTWVYGTDEDAENRYTATVVGLVGDDANLDLTQTQANFSAILKVRRICGDGVGVYANGLEPYFALATTGAQVTGDENICKNYQITLNKGKLTVSKSTLKLKVKDVENTYGEAFTAAQLQFELAEDPMNEGIDDLIKNNINSYLTFDNTEYELETATKYEVGNDYALGFVGTVTATNFEFDSEILPGKFTVSKRPITLTAKAQAVNLSTPGSEFKTALIDGTTVDVSGEGIATGDVIDDLGVTLMYETFHVGDNNVINFNKANANQNYEFTYENAGIYLTVTGATTATFANYSDIQTYAGKPVTVKLDMTARDLTYRTPADEAVVAGGKTYVWPYQKEEWFALVLPFEISVADLSQAFGYAIVNRLDDVELMSDNKLNIKFKVEMDYIPANEPFVLKTSKAVSEINGTGIIDFGLQEIVDDGANPSITKGGYSFYGTYNDVQLTKEQTKWSFLAGGDWKKVSATSSNHYDLSAFDCYFDRADADAREFVFTFQDIDGTATAIRSVSADGESKSYAEGWYTIDGMKLNAAPAQKGIYINNGKKVVIK